jgi:hypothetical protein
VLGDLQWVQTSDPNAQGLLSQLLVNCGGLFGNDCSVVQPPDFVSPCLGSAYTGDASHEVVRVCKPTVDYIVSIAIADEAHAITTSLVQQRAYLGALGTAASNRGPFLSGSGPDVTSVIQAVSVGGVLHVTGSGFGTQAGSVVFAGPSGVDTVPGTLALWSNEAVDVTVPSGAESGPIMLHLADGTRVLAGSVAILGSGGPTLLKVVQRGTADAGASQTVHVYALDSKGKGIPGVKVDLFDGSVDTSTATTDIQGDATFTVFGTGTQNFIAHASSASASFVRQWRPASFALYPLQVTTTSLPPGALNQVYSAQLAASGGNLPYRWSLLVGELPEGLHLTKATGMISGTPRVSGTFTFTVKVVDDKTKMPHTQNTATKVLSITIS